jgi:hypothetical protein
MNEEETWEEDRENFISDGMNGEDNMFLRQDLSAEYEREHPRPKPTKRLEPNTRASGAIWTCFNDIEMELVISALRASGELGLLNRMERTLYNARVKSEAEQSKNA